MIFASGFRHPEGPVAMPDGSLLLVEGGEGRGCITHVSADGKSRGTVVRTGRPNGLAIDARGALWVAESKPAALLRVSPDGRIEVVLTECEGEPFLFPNDLCFGPDGALYLTDSGVNVEDFAPGGKIRGDYMDVAMDGRVYRIDTETGAIAKLDSGIRFTNGIAFGPEHDLYVNETITGMVYRYAWNDGAIGRREPFGNVIHSDAAPGYKGPDGMAFGADGKLYVTVFGQRDVTVLGRDGDVVDRIATSGSRPSNVAFGLRGVRRIFITECELGQIESVEVDTTGLPLWGGEAVR